MIPKRLSLALAASVVLVLLAVAVTGSLGDGEDRTRSSWSENPAGATPSASLTPPTTTSPEAPAGSLQEWNEPVSMSALADFAPNALTLPFATRYSEIIVYGVVTEVDPGRWNSGDGQRWTTAGEEGTPAIYSTFYVQPDQVLKGFLRFGEPVAFMVLGGTEGVVTGPVNVGDKVLVFGYYDQSILGQVTWKKDAYWTTLETYGVFKQVDNRLVNLVDPSAPDIGETSVADVQGLVAAEQ